MYIPCWFQLCGTQRQKAVAVLLTVRVIIIDVSFACYRLQHIFKNISKLLC